jgi:hypothetical protein
LFSTTSPVAPPATPFLSRFCIVARGCTPLTQKICPKRGNHEPRIQ